MEGDRFQPGTYAASVRVSGSPDELEADKKAGYQASKEAMHKLRKNPMRHGLSPVGDVEAFCRYEPWCDQTILTVTQEFEVFHG